MNPNLIDALKSRAAKDAAEFSSSHPGELPNTRWVENSFTAALPLVKNGADVSDDASLFAIYRDEIAARIGGVREDRGEKGDVINEPPPGLN
jgi:hypothetical protein